MLKKWFLPIILLILLMIPLVYAEVVECKRVMQPEEANECLATATWNYTKPCSSHSAMVYDNNNGTNIQNYTFYLTGSSPLCTFTWNISAIGSYSFVVDNGDTGNILVEVKNMLLSIIIGCGIVILYFGFLSFWNKEKGIKFLTGALALVEVIFLLGIIYVMNSGGDINNLLRINFYIMGIIGLGIGVYSLYEMSVHLVVWEDSPEKPQINKWKNKNKW